MDHEIATLLVELIEKVGLLRRDMQHKKELEKYEARFQRIEQKFNALAERLSRRIRIWPRRCERRGSFPPAASPSATPIIRRDLKNRSRTSWLPLALRPFRLIRQVPLVAHFLDLMELRFEPVDVHLFVLQQNEKISRDASSPCSRAILTALLYIATAFSLEL